MTRVLTALVLIPVVIGLLFYAPPLAVRAALALAALLCLRECLNIVRAMGVEPFGPAAFAAGAVLILTSVPMGPYLIGVTVLLMMLTLDRTRHQTALTAVSTTLFAVIYTCGPFALARELHEMSPHWLFAPLLVNWVGDSSAMYVGKAIGRHKLAPTVSPGKTWEGTIASFVLGSAVGAGYLHYVLPDANLLFVLGFAAVSNVAGQLGDLSESVLKRGAKMKDSGELLPGHGGMLDRMDGALFAFPAAFLYLTAAMWM
ncbi:MAG: phosphatidate cytidylyltransferase [Bryobacterales bacterium]|nr:phosphatidate cytidylyltransferase [Acidobacteriota bacterium]MCB9384776.1 phosphatidate cytidylyltransferase [Bryobacterales bacterium]